MNGIKDKLIEEIERQKDKLIDDEHLKENYRDITRVQAPDPWPDPPKENEERGGNEK